jgi:prolyl-tRNA editing enzyme YbaK/EbsC (Cys-tRNA(Pro) deacylase)
VRYHEHPRVPPVGHREKFPVVVDTRVVARDWGYAGGRRPEFLVKIKSPDIIRLMNGAVHEVVSNSVVDLPEAEG